MVFAVVNNNLGSEDLADLHNEMHKLMALNDSDEGKYQSVPIIVTSGVPAVNYFIDMCYSKLDALYFYVPLISYKYIYYTNNKFVMYFMHL